MLFRSRRLEYRGYDSCGLALRVGKRIVFKRARGKIARLQEVVNHNISFSAGIAHTRWATHGAPSLHNAHPHCDCKREVFVAHNGIIENYQEMRARLIKQGHCFVSQTDTEVIPHLIEQYCKKYTFFNAFLKTVNALRGSFAIVVLTRREKALFFARKDSPLIIGIVKDGFMLASDTPAMPNTACDVIYLQDGWLGRINETIEIFDFSGRKVQPKISTRNIITEEITKKHYPHFMLKEIYEQPRVSANLFSLYVRNNKIKFKELGVNKKFLTSLNKIFIFACGTAYHAGFVAKYFLEEMGIDVELGTSSEARYRSVNLGRNDLVLAISQSGETADTLAAAQMARQHGAKVISICNVLGSTLTRQSDGLIYTLAGPEIGVASTKAYTAQVFSLMLFALYLAFLRNAWPRAKINKFLAEFQKVSSYQRSILQTAAEIKDIAGRFSKFGCFLFLGRGINYPSALEGALKLKEISYIPAEGYPAGEMKHGPIALIDEYRAVVCIVPRDALYAKMVSNVQEIQARRGKVLGIVNDRDLQSQGLTDAQIIIPAPKHAQLNPLLTVIPLQLFAYFVAKNLGCTIDQPRNLAKSVTVE